MLRCEGPLGRGTGPCDTHEVGHRIEHVVAANFLGRIGFKCRNFLRMRLAVGGVYPDEGGDLEFGRNVSSRPASYSPSVEGWGRLTVCRGDAPPWSGMKVAVAGTCRPRPCWITCCRNQSV